MSSIPSLTPPYKNAQHLLDEVSPQWSKIYKESSPGMKIQTVKKEVKRAFQGYLSAMEPRMPFVVLGSNAIREDERLIENLGTLATDPQYNQQKIKDVFMKSGVEKGKKLNELALEHLTSGAIVNDSNWWIFRNDVFMLGAIHANKDFHIAYTGMQGVSKGVPPDRLLWDEENERPRALGREILMLAFAGYIPVYAKIMGKTGLGFSPPNTPSTHSLTEMRALIKKSSQKDLDLYLSKIDLIRYTPSPSPSPTLFNPIDLQSPSSVSRSSLDLTALSESPDVVLSERLSKPEESKEE